MCECDFDMSIYTNEMTFQGGVNKVLLDLINEKKLIGVSLKKVTGNTANLTEHNFTRASLTVKKPFVKAIKNSYNSMDVYLEGRELVFSTAQQLIEKVRHGRVKS